jgi:hypothetical protein
MICLGHIITQEAEVAHTRTEAAGAATLDVSRRFLLLLAS